jgi:hypothetical protein
LREQIAIEEKKDIQNKYDRRIITISRDYIKLIKNQAEQFISYKTFINF